MPLLSVALDRLPSAATLAVWRSVRTAIGESVFDEAVTTLQQAPEHLAQLRWDGPEHIEASEQERALAAYEMQPSIAVFVQRVREMAAARHPCACPSTVRQQQPNFLVSQGSPQAPQGQQGAESWTARLDAAGVDRPRMGRSHFQGFCACASGHHRIYAGAQLSHAKVPTITERRGSY